MKLTFIFLLACAVNVVSGQSDPPKTKAPATRTAPPEIKIPEGATKTDDGSFKFTDAKGKKWLYRNTPFGVAKTEDKPVDPLATPFGKAKAQDKPAAEPAAVADMNPTLAFEDGDSYRFERNTPFGVSKWKKKKTDLDASELRIIAEQKSKK